MPVAEPDLELSGVGVGAVFIYLPRWPFSLLSFLLFDPSPSPRSATGTGRDGRVFWGSLLALTQNIDFI